MRQPKAICTYTESVGQLAALAYTFLCVRERYLGERERGQLDDEGGNWRYLIAGAAGRARLENVQTERQCQPTLMILVFSTKNSSTCPQAQLRD